MAKRLGAKLRKPFLLTYISQENSQEYLFTLCCVSFWLLLIITTIQLSLFPQLFDSCSIIVRLLFDCCSIDGIEQGSKEIRVDMECFVYMSAFREPNDTA